MKKQRFHGVFTKEQISKIVEGILQFAEENPDWRKELDNWNLGVT